MQISPDPFRGALSQARALNCRSQSFLRFEFGDTLWTRKQVALKFGGACSVEFAVEITVEDGVRHFTAHVGPPDSLLRQPNGSAPAAAAAAREIELTLRCRSAST